jgi:UDP-glucose 4-epimerase
LAQLGEAGWRCKPYYVLARAIIIYVKVRSTSMSRINKVLVTGSRGFIGRHLCKRLEEVGIAVQTSYKSFDSDLGDNHLDNNIDITNMERLHSFEKGAEAIVHLAAKSSFPDSFNRPYETYYTNILGTLNLLELARLRNIRKFIFISTYVYGQPKYLPIDEKHQVNPNSPYTMSKFIAEQLCEKYSADFGIDVVSLRPFYIYGPNSSSRFFINSAIRQIKETGTVLLSGELTTRDFLFVKDFVDLIEVILRGFPVGYNLYNVGYGKSHTLKQACEFLSKSLKKDVRIGYDEEIRRGDVTSMVADISKVTKAFSWKPSIDLEKGLELIVNNSEY